MMAETCYESLFYLEFQNYFELAGRTNPKNSEVADFINVLGASIADDTLVSKGKMPQKNGEH